MWWITSTHSSSPTCKKSWRSSAHCITTTTHVSTPVCTSSPRPDTRWNPSTLSPWRNWTARLVPNTFLSVTLLMLLTRKRKGGYLTDKPFSPLNTHTINMPQMTSGSSVLSHTLACVVQDTMCININTGTLSGQPSWLSESLFIQVPFCTIPHTIK